MERDSLLRLTSVIIRMCFKVVQHAEGHSCRVPRNVPGSWDGAEGVYSSQCSADVLRQGVPSVPYALDVNRPSSCGAWGLSTFSPPLHLCGCSVGHRAFYWNSSIYLVLARWQAPIVVVYMHVTADR